MLLHFDVGRESSIKALDEAMTSGQTIFLVAQRDLAIENPQEGDLYSICLLYTSGFFLSSANSINWGRVLPQIVYYISAYCDLLRDGKLQKGDPVNVCVPTGNFGNILAAYYAREMSVPIKRLVCASNSNNVLTDFLKTGIYDRNRTFYNTMSPSMDILISSNLERLLFALSGHDDDQVREYMAELGQSGRYEVSKTIKDKMDKLFSAGYCDDTQTLSLIHI